MSGMVTVLIGNVSVRQAALNRWTALVGWARFNVPLDTV